MTEPQRFISYMLVVQSMMFDSRSECSCFLLQRVQSLVIIIVLVACLCRHQTKTLRQNKSKLYNKRNRHFLILLSNQKLIFSFQRMKIMNLKGKAQATWT